MDGTPSRIGTQDLKRHPSKLLHSELYNGTDPNFAGFTAAAVKGIDEYEPACNYVHDHPANGAYQGGLHLT